MVKTFSKFVCQQCGHEETKWFGKCPDCGSWNSAVETVVLNKNVTRGASRSSNSGINVSPITLNSITTQATTRTSTRISELDRVLGGGLVPGQVVLIAGEPGIGKSTLLLQVAEQLAANRQSPVPGNDIKYKVSNHSTRIVLYTSGEESPTQIKVRADRLGISEAWPTSSVKNNNIQLLDSTNIDDVIDSAHSLLASGLSLLIVDSIQTMATSDLSGMAGSVGQVRECAFRLVRFAKETGTPVFIVGHVTKEGSVAGPSVLMHIVDTVLWFEGDKSLTYRFLRAVKNRFGATDEVGVFSMEDKGLESLDNPESIFLADAKTGLTGTAIASVMQGSRPLLVEIQSLIVPTKLAIPRRIAQGIDPRRFELLLAVLTRRAGLPLYDYDAFVNVAGGISIKGDPSADLAICLSIASSFYDKPLSKDVIAIGEVGLLGDVRQVVAQDKRAKEAKRLGYKNVVTNKEVKFLREAVKKYIK